MHDFDDRLINASRDGAVEPKVGVEDVVGVSRGERHHEFGFGRLFARPRPPVGGNDAVKQHSRSGRCDVDRASVVNIEPLRHRFGRLHSRFTDQWRRRGGGDRRFIEVHINDLWLDDVRRCIPIGRDRDGGRKVANVVAVGCVENADVGANCSRSGEHDAGNRSGSDECGARVHGWRFLSARPPDVDGLC